MKFICLATFVFLLSSCKKDITQETVVDVTADTNVSGKLKRTIQSLTGTTIANIFTFEYDASNRLSKLKEWEEDSSFNPIKITGEKSTSFTYSGASELPKKTITFRTTAVDSTLYYYDAQNRVTKEDWYSNKANRVRNLYLYSNNLIVMTSYNGAVLQLFSTDSLILDNQGKNIETRFYNSSNVYNGKSLSTYDAKINPLSYLNAFKWIFTLNGDDRKGPQYRAVNNQTIFKKLNSSSVNYYTLNINYLYSPNSFPVSSSIVETRTSPTVIQNSAMKFEYY